MMVSNQQPNREQKYAKKRKRNKKATNRQFAIIAIAIGTFVLSLTALLPQATSYLESRQRYREIKTSYEQAENQQATLEIQLKKSQYPNYIQQYAREKYFLSHPGEVLLVLPTPPNPELAEAEPSFIEKILDFFRLQPETKAETEAG